MFPYVSGIDTKLQLHCVFICASHVYITSCDLLVKALDLCDEAHGKETQGMTEVDYLWFMGESCFNLYLQV